MCYTFINEGENMEIYITKKEQSQIELQLLESQESYTRQLLSKLIVAERDLPSTVSYKKRCQLNNLILDNKNKISKLLKKRNEIIIKNMQE
jgi:hypothetical protein